MVNSPGEIAISAVVLAAGLSSRMGKPKLILPWGETTVLGRVLHVLNQAQLSEIIIVTGGARDQVEQVVSQQIGMTNAWTIFNPDFTNGEMLGSIQIGLTGCSSASAGALIVLGDQPQIQPEIVQKVIRVFAQSQAPIVVPSYQMHRGHPWIIHKDLWPEVIHLQSPLTLRNFLVNHQRDIEYLNVDQISILQDLDTPEDYQRQNPRDHFED